MAKYILYNKNNNKVKAIATKKPNLDEDSILQYIEVKDSEVDMEKFSIRYKTEIKDGNIIHTKKITNEDIKKELKDELEKVQSLEDLKKVVEKLLK